MTVAAFGMALIGLTLFGIVQSAGGQDVLPDTSQRTAVNAENPKDTASKDLPGGPALPGAVVVELFTSESCSSCPPAERLLNLIDEEAEAKGLPVYALAFHVDYWNYLDWEDRFSDAAYTQRQREYARRVFRTGRVYTPQMIVGGHTGFTGSNGTKAKQAISDALATPALLSLSAESQAVSEHQVRVTVQIGASWDGLLRAALVENGLETTVKGGENRGRKLVHRAVVRAFATRRTGGDETVTLLLGVPQEVDPDQSSVVVYAQDATNWTILGATRATKTAATE